MAPVIIHRPTDLYPHWWMNPQNGFVCNMAHVPKSEKLNNGDSENENIEKLSPKVIKLFFILISAKLDPYQIAPEETWIGVPVRTVASVLTSTPP